MAIPWSVNPDNGVLGHIVSRIVANEPFLHPGPRQAVCTCGATADITINGTMLGLPLEPDNFEELQQGHYLAVIVAALELGPNAVRVTSGEVQHSGVLSPASHPPGHDFEADEEFPWPDPHQPPTRRPPFGRPARS